MYQEKLSAMLLKNNGRLSSGNRTKHTCIRYFLIKDIIAMGVLRVKYFPTGEMLSGYFTKPLQGYAFRKFRVEIQGIPEDTPYTYLGWDRFKGIFIPSSQECVERSDIKTDMRTNKSR